MTLANPIFMVMYLLLHKGAIDSLLRDFDRFVF